VPSRPLIWLLALAGAALVVLGSPAEDAYWNDFGAEALPAFERLVEGDLTGFLAASPIAYGGSMIVRAPFGALAGALGLEGGGIFRLSAVPCLLALAALAVYLARRARERFPDDRWWLVVLGLGAASPIAWKAIGYGHPEELLATALTVGAVLAALRDRAVAAGLMLGAAVACKQWAVIAVLPTLLAASRHHVRLLAAAAGAGGALLLPFVLTDPAGYATAQQAVGGSGVWFRPRQLWWPFGDVPPAGLRLPRGGAVTPAWLTLIAKPLIVAITLPLAALWLRRRAERTDALLLLALIFLLRCLLDPWNVLYYHLPLVLALLAWEVVSGRRIPVLTLLATSAVWLSFETYDAALGTGPWLAYLAWTLPLAAHLAWRLYRPALARRVGVRAAVPAPA
jgi:hypothetical protein